MTATAIDTAAAACRAAWAAAPDATAAAHCHHGDEPFELLNATAETRIAYILAHKPEDEQVRRLDCFRPLTAPAWADYDRITASALAEYERVTASALADNKRITASAWADYDRITASALAEYERVEAAAHQRLCPVIDCPWDGESIFGEDDE